MLVRMQKSQVLTLQGGIYNEMATLEKSVAIILTTPIESSLLGTYLKY